MPASADPERRAPRSVGTTLCGKYRLERVLGAGGMATVYAAVHRNGNRVAIKVLHEELSIRGDTRARFQREGYVANMVGHAGAVRVLDDDVTEGGAAFLVMELLEGETLRARCRRAGGRLPCREALALVHQLLDVLDAAHAAGIIHRDIKPENLFLTTDRVLKVLDFGIARVEDDPGVLATATGVRLGTPGFMPPELALGRSAEVDARTDVWSTGATLFQLISGQIVHDAASSAEVMVHAATRPARPLSSVAPEAPAEIAALVDRALAFARDDRWPSARAMREAIEEAHAALYGEPITIDAVGPVSDGEPLHDAESTTVAAPDGSSAAAGPRRPTLPYASTEQSDEASNLPASRALAVRAPPRWKRAAPLLIAFAAIAALLGARRIFAPPAPPALQARAHAPSCTANADCAGGRPSLCRKEDGTCVALESDECRVLAEPGDMANDATVWIGAMWPIREKDPLHYGPQAANAVDLARRDFVETSGGLPPARLGGPRRPIGVVLCDDRKEPDKVAGHLVNDLRVPAVLGFASSKEAIDLATSVFLPRGVLMIIATGSATMVRDIPRPPGGPRLSWRVTPATDLASWPFAAVVEHVIEPELRSARGLLKPGESIRVAQLRQNSLAGQSTVDSRLKELHFNGKTVAENGDAFRQIVRADYNAGGDFTEATERTASAIAAFRPHVVLDMPPHLPLLAAVERAWPADAPFRPRYLTEGTWPDLGKGTIDWSRDGLHRRLFVFDLVSSRPALVRFALRYNEFFSPQITPATAPSTPYDAFYLFAYAAAALGEQPITGAALAGAIPRLLPPGEPVDVGPGGIYPALLALGAGKNIDLQGAASSFDLDPATGDTSVDFALYCLSAGHDEPARQIESGLSFNARERKLVGTRRCP